MFGLFRRKKKTEKPPEAVTVQAAPRHEPGSQSPQAEFFAAVCSHVGSVRSNNEDNYILGPHLNAQSADRTDATLRFSFPVGTFRFVGVFDGMGGGEAGELASRDTARIFQAACAQAEKLTSREQLDRTIRTAFLDANRQIVALQKQYQVFGTTGTLLCTDGREYKLYHLGDSRAYLLRDGAMTQLTKDQTLAQMKLEVGMYKSDDPAIQADKHKLTEYIGRDWTCDNLRPLESRWCPLEPGDILLLCSDGLYDMCSDQQIRNCLYQEGSPARKAAQLVEAAIAGGGEDNITCIVAAFGR